MNYLDISVIAFIVLLAGLGLYLGFIRITFSVLSILIGSLIAAKFYTYGTKFFYDNNWSLLFSFAIMFFLSSAIIMLIGRVISSFLKHLLLKPIDRLFGSVIMVTVGFFMIGSALKLMTDFNNNGNLDRELKKSKAISIIQKTDKVVFGFIPNKLSRKASKLFSKKINKELNVTKKNTN